MTRLIRAIDPGNTQSGWIELDPQQRRPVAMGVDDNAKVLARLRYRSNHAPTTIIEQVRSYGMAVGRDVFETCEWTGRFAEAAGSRGSKIVLMPRQDVKLCLCKSPKAKDANIRQALLDMFPADGGGKTPQIGTKAQPGPLYGVKSHIWSALALAVTYTQQQVTQGTP
jgi:hypothetical protein